MTGWERAQGAIFIGRGAIKVIGICSIEGGCVVFIHGRSLILDSLAPFGFEGSPDMEDNQGNNIATIRSAKPSHSYADGDDADDADDDDKEEVVIKVLSHLPHAEVEHCADVDDQEESAHNGKSKHWRGNILCKRESKRKRDENEEKVIKKKG